jgi:hypothetical protein
MVRHLHALPQTLTFPLDFFKIFQNLAHEGRKEIIRILPYHKKT